MKASTYTGSQGDVQITTHADIAESEGPFGLTVWGLDSYSSYAYPAGGSARALTDVIVTPQ